MPSDSSPARLSVLVPAISATSLERKLRDLRRLASWIDEVVVCFNGAERDLARVEEIVAREDVLRCVLSVTSPFNKAEALRGGLAHVSSTRILYSDVDCLIHGEPGELRPVLETDDVCTFLVLRATPRSKHEVLLKLARRRVLARVYRALGLVYLSARGGGYVAGDMTDVIDERVLSDDLVFPAEHAAARGVRVVPSEALVFYEAHADGRRYADKLPRLIYGSFQAARLARARRLRASLAVEKLAKYLLVAAVPPAALGAIAARRLPPWLGLALLFRARLFVRTWEGVLRGVGDRPPRW